MSEVKINKMRVRGVTGNLKAFFVLSIGELEIDDMRLVDSVNGLFVAFPSKRFKRQDGTDGWVDIVRLTRNSDGSLSDGAAKTRDNILSAAKEEYQRRTGDELASNTAATDNNDDLPF
jgi:DNA-binding cell septation regulator SpoVG